MQWRAEDRVSAATRSDWPRSAKVMQASGPLTSLLQVSDAAGQVWWLYGPPSVGKSATAWELFTQVLNGEPRGYFDIDQVGMCSPEPADDPGRYALKARAAVRVVRRFTDAGVRTVIISGVADERSMSTFLHEVGGAGVTFCRLRVDPEELKRRLSTRYGLNDTARALAEAHRWDRYDSAGLLVDTGEGDPLDNARRVAEAVRSAAAPAPVTASGPPSSSAQAAAGADPGRAVLICGPAGVGKSTVGFGLFGHLQGDGRTAAYLDLQQLGFLADLPQGAPGGHKIVAGCVADLWEEYRAVGTQDLVLTGNVEQMADVQRYRDALGATPLVVCRLRTSPEALRDRIMARTRGGGPMLAGDALLGLTADKAEIVLHEALTQQSRLDRVDPADVTLETADRSPEAVTHSARAAFDRLTSVGS